MIPILAPALKPLGVDPVHFSIIFTHNMEIALIHPPVGLNLYVLATISDAPIGEVIRGILPFLILLLIVLVIITYVPALTMWLPANLVLADGVAAWPVAPRTSAPALPPNDQGREGELLLCGPGGGWYQLFCSQKPPMPRMVSMHCSKLMKP